MKAEVIATLHDEELESPFTLAHDEGIGGWSTRIGDCLVSFCSIDSLASKVIVEVTDL